MDFGKILGGIAPFIASALPGPFGVAAKAILGGVFGIGEDAKDADEQITEAIAKATPEQIVALKKAEQDFQARMMEMGHKNVEALDRLAKEDTANARQREIEMAKTGQKDWMPAILGISAIAGFIAVVLFCLLSDLDKWGQSKVGIVSGLLGTLTTVVVMIFGYYFGSSSGSAAKNVMLDKLSNTVTK